ncbi:MAG: helix-turn-helix domain-containing protein [Pseudonocardiaceae bacterium]
MRRGSGPVVIIEPVVIISGAPVYLLSKLLSAAPVVAFLRCARWTANDEFAATLRAIHEAGRAWQAVVELRERNNAVRCARPVSGRATMSIEEASERLGIGERRVQQLAQSGRITGRRVGQRWQLDQVSVAAYQHHHQKRTG